MQALHEIRKHEAKVKDFVHQALLRLQGTCVYCRIFGAASRQVHSHLSTYCNFWHESYGVSPDILFGGQRPWRKQMQFVPNTCCFHCGCPQSICPQGHEGGSGKNCIYRKAVWYVVHAASHREEYRALMVEASSKVQSDPYKFFLQLSVACQWQGEGCNRMIVFCQRIFEKLGWWEEYVEEGGLH